jgi:hypothetical protein
MATPEVEVEVRPAEDGEALYRSLGFTEITTMRLKLAAT